MYNVNLFLYFKKIGSTLRNHFTDWRIKCKFFIAIMFGFLHFHIKKFVGNIIIIKYVLFCTV